MTTARWVWGLLWIYWLILFFVPFASGVRFGGALHPGPTFEHGSDTASSFRFCLGTADVAGFSNKLDLIHSLPGGVWGCTETQLTEDGIRFARNHLRLTGQQAGRCLRTVFGAPAPCRSLSSTAGTWTGVCAVADFPLSHVPIQWQGTDFSCGRTLVASVHIGAMSLTCGIVYLWCCAVPDFSESFGHHTVPP